MTNFAVDYTYTYPFASEVCANEAKPLVRLSTFDDKGSRHARRIQAWLELPARDARQHETAKDLYQPIIIASKA